MARSLTSAAMAVALRHSGSLAIVRAPTCMRAITPLQHSVAPLRRMATIPKFAWGEPSHLSVGDTCSMVKSFSAADVRAFGGACLDWNPVHYPEGYAEKAALQEAAWRSDPATASLPLPTDRGIRRFPGPIVHGMLTASLIGTLFATHLPGSIYLAQNLSFRAPVLYDEPVTARIEVLRVERRGRVVCRTTVEKQDDKGNTVIVIDGEAKVLVESLQQQQQQQQTNETQTRTTQ